MHEAIGCGKEGGRFRRNIQMNANIRSRARRSLIMRNPRGIKHHTSVGVEDFRSVLQAGYPLP
jgi:hypothetical protein